MLIYLKFLCWNISLAVLRMVPFSGALAVACFWLAILMADRSLRKYKKCSRWYRRALEEYGISVSVAQLRWYTTTFNNTFFKWGKLRTRFLLTWFNTGVIFGGFSMVSSVLVLSIMLYKALTEEKPEQVLTPVMPGMNLPWKQVFYYFVTLMASGIIHEVGHAIAAIRENVRVNGFGLFLFAIYPGAFVDLHTDHLTVISPLRQLRIFCAGVWHNFVLALVAFGNWWFLPYILLPLYTTNRGAVVTNVLQTTSVYKNFPVGDQVTGINGCPVNSADDWGKCLSQTINGPVMGYCNGLATVARKNTSMPHLKWNGAEPDCCNESTSSRFCFWYLQYSGNKAHACLPARTTVSRLTCHTDRDCHGFLDRVCLRPLTSNSTRLLKISHRTGQDVLFVGNPYELLYTVSMSDYLPKADFISLHIPGYIQTMLLYTVSLSGALALLNMVPCYSLDGQWTLMAFIDYLLPPLIQNKVTRTILYHVVLLTGTILLLANIIFALWTLSRS